MANLRDIAVAKRLGGWISAVDVRYVIPTHWVAAALIQMEADGLAAEHNAKQQKRRSRRR